MRAIFLRSKTEARVDSFKNEVAESLAQVADKVLAWWETFIEMIPNMFVAVLLFILFYCLPKLYKRHLLSFLKNI
jgi:hypothetical protein